MRMRRHRSAKSFLLLLFVLMFACWWAVSALSVQTSYTGPQITQAQIATPVPYTPTTPLVITHSVLNGAQIYSGEFTPPSLCDNLGVGSRLALLEKPHISIALMLTTPGSCSYDAPAPPQPFSISITANGPAFDGVTINGEIVPSVVVEK